MKKINYIPVSLIFAFFICAFFHELGHCIAVWLYGGEVTGLSLWVWDAHVSYKGAWVPLVHLAGGLLELLVGFCLFFTYRRGEAWTFVKFLKTTYIVICIVNLVSWVSASAAFALGIWDSTSDAMRFIAEMSISPVPVMLGASVLSILMIFILAKKLADSSPPGMQKKDVRRMGGFMAACLLAGSVVAATGIFFNVAVGREMSGSFRIAGGSGDAMLKKQFDIQIKEDGSYIVYAEWGIDRPGIITAAVLSRGDEHLFYGTGEKAILFSEPLELESGTYTLSIYSISDMEDWEEYFNVLGEESVELDYHFQNADAYHVYGGYEIVKTK